MTPEKLTEEESRLLRHETFIAELLRRRAGSGSDSRPASGWRRFLETSSGTALITVLIGGIMGNVITGFIQNRQARSARTFLAFQEHLKGQHETVKAAYDLIGNCILASEDLISLTGEGMASGAYVDIDEQRKTIVNDYNKVDARWRGEKDRLGLLMSYYHPGKDELRKEWDKTQTAVTTYMNCASDWYTPNPVAAHSKETIKANACPVERAALTNQLTAFSEKLNESRTYPWERSEAPER
jgi:hypothetical protein